MLAFIRSYGDEQILVVANLSRFVQYVELDLSRFKGSAPIELFGRTQFPRIGDLPYLLTLGPHMFDWFSIERREDTAHFDISPHQVPELVVTETWDRFMHGEDRERLRSRSCPTTCQLSMVPQQGARKSRPPESASSSRCQRRRP